MKPHTVYEQALKTVTLFEHEIAGPISVSGQFFREAVFKSFAHFAKSDGRAVIQREKDSELHYSITEDDTEKICASPDSTAWKKIFAEKSVYVAEKNDGTLVHKKYRTWVAIPVHAKKGVYLLVIIARKSNAFHDLEIQAAADLSVFFTQALQTIRSKNKKTSSVADDTRHRILLHTQASIGRIQPELRGLARGIDYSSLTGSDIAQAYQNNDETLFIYVCDVTADDNYRQTGLIYLDAWFSILSQTSLDAQGILQRLNQDMTARHAECYASIALVRYARKDCRVEIAGGGNVCVTCFSHDSMGVRDCEFGPPLGIKVDTDIRMYTVPVKSGDIVCVFSDGISETRKKNGELFGSSAVGEIIRKNYFLSAQELTTKILSTAIEKEEKSIKADDRTLFVLKIE